LELNFVRRQKAVANLTFETGGPGVKLPVSIGSSFWTFASKRAGGECLSFSVSIV